MSIIEDSNRYTNNRVDAYHDTDQCRLIKRPDAYTKRPVWYVEERDLRPCRFCHDALDSPGGKNDADWGPQKALRKAAQED
jgi:hypothetical protein